MDVELHALLLNLYVFFRQIERLSVDDPREIKAIKKKAAQYRECIKAHMLSATDEPDADLE